MTRGEEYRTVIRTGKRSKVSSLQLYLKAGEPEDESRFGFVISKKVGNAVQRNRLRRQLKAIIYQHLPSFYQGRLYVIRLFPNSAELKYSELEAAVLAARDNLV